MNPKKIVLIVEDDADIRDSIMELLADAGYETRAAANGAEAIKVLESGLRPNLILLDLMMPVMDGFTFRDEQVKHPEWAEIPVVIMSADGNISQKQAKAGAVAYLKKPVDIDDLVGAVERSCS